MRQLVSWLCGWVVCQSVCWLVHWVVSQCGLDGSWFVGRPVRQLVSLTREQSMGQSVVWPVGRSVKQSKRPYQTISIANTEHSNFQLPSFLFIISIASSVGKTEQRSCDRISFSKPHIQPNISTNC